MAQRWTKKPRRGGHSAPPKARPWSRKWTLYAPPTSEDGAVPVAPVSFRVLSFNVLADYIAMKTTAVEKPEEAWKYEWSYRCRRLLKEILAWRPHVVCLQEVDHYADFFEPEMQRAGYEGVYKKRTGENMLDGCAVFVLSSSISIVTWHGLEFFTPGHAVLDRHNIAIQAVLEWQPGDAPPRRFVIANTHILFNPGRGDVKLAQLEMLFESLAELRASEYAPADGSILPLILCGDFNLAPHGALYEFISRGSLRVSGLSKHMLSGQHLDFHEKQLTFTNENDHGRHHGHGTAMGRFNGARAKRHHNHFPKNTTATHALELSSAYAQSPTDWCTGEPKFTTFHDGTKATVDYIWYSKSSLHCHGVVEMVPAGLLFAAKCLPTEFHSSDHLPLVADFSVV